MDFIFKDSNDRYNIDDSNLEEKSIIESFIPMFESRGIDPFKITTGVMVAPDFGYFSLADRYWCSSLCIYFSGISSAFFGSGIGYTEPWLFNVRHSFELYLKGFLMFHEWYIELNKDILANDRKERVNRINNSHGLHELYYSFYKTNIQNTIRTWNVEGTSDIPDISKLILSENGEKILTEFANADSDGFRFRYPSMRRKVTSNKGSTYHEIQEWGWEHDDKKLYDITKLPKEAGVFFDHINSINRLHELYVELYDISRYHYAGWSYYGEYQDILKDMMSDY